MAAASKGIAQRVTEAFTRLTVAALSRSRLLRALVGDRLGDRLWLRDLVRRAGAPDRATRLTALQHIWDYLDFVAWTDEAVAPVVAALVALAPGETDDEVLEQLLADLMKAFHGPKWKGRAPDFAAVSFDPIAELIVRPGFPEPLIGYGLLILAYSGQIAYRPVLERFLTHPRQDVREEVAAALVELEASRVHR